MKNQIVEKQYSEKQYPNFTSFLKSELARRCAKNPAYSLRAFSKLLGVSHAALSQVMSGKRPLTLKSQRQMALALALSPEQFINFQMSKDITFEEQFQTLNIEKYDILADWTHDAILELTNLRSFKPDPKWIALVLDISVHEVNAAVDKLVRNKLLKIEKTKWTDLSVNNTVNHLGDFTNPALRKYQKDLLEKSIDVLESLPREERDHTSLMLNFSAKNIQEAKDMIKEFRTQFSVKSKLKSKNADEVFALSISFFPISKIKSLKNKKEQK
ncbi:MAG: TIGR02147 family protein [Bdellovibrionota bacterium]